jgi:hypothetical protein
MMMNLDKCKPHPLGLPWGLLILWTMLLVFMARGFPFTGDDFNRVRAGSPAVGDLLNYATHSWRNTNGRVLGNLFSFLFVDYPGMLAAVRGGSMVLLTVLLVKVTGVCSRLGWAAAMAGVLFLPPMIFREAYPWNAGFFNYVPPVILLIWTAWLFKLHLVRPAALVSWRDLLLLGLGGGASTLFMENLTVFALIAGGAALFASIFYVRRLLPQAGAYFAGVLGGSMLMFASPVYRTVQEGADGYRSYAESLGGLLYRMAGNYRILSVHLLHNNGLLIALVCGAALLSSALLPKRRVTPFMQAMVIAGAGYFLTARYFAEDLGLLSLTDSMTAASLGVDLTALGLLLIPVVWSLWQSRNRWGMGFVLAALLVAAPLLLVSPIGPRNAYALHILLVAAILTMLQPIEEHWTKTCNALGTAVLITVLIGAGSYGYMFFRIGQTQALQYSHIRQQMEVGAEIIELPRYPYAHLVHGPHGAKIGNLFFYQRPSDISFVFIPYDDWYAQWGETP